MKKSSFLSFFGGGIIVALSLMGALTGCGKGPIVADVNGTPITEKEFLDKLKRSPLGRDVLVRLIQDRLILDELNKNNLEVTDAEVNKAYKQLWQQFGFRSEADFLREAQARGGSRDIILQEIRLGLAREELLLKDAKGTPEDVKRYFEQHRERYDQPETVTLNVITVQEKATAEKVIKQLGENRTWDDVAKEVSLTPPAPQQFPTYALDSIFGPEIEAAIKKLEVGRYTPPLPNLQGQHVLIRLLDRKPKVPTKFEDVEDEVEREYKLEQVLKQRLQPFDYQGQPEQEKTRILQGLKQQAEQEMLTNLQRSANVVVRDPDLLSVERAFGTQPAAVPALPAVPPSPSPPTEGGSGK